MEHRSMINALLPRRPVLRLCRRRRWWHRKRAGELLLALLCAATLTASEPPMTVPYTAATIVAAHQDPVGLTAGRLLDERIRQRTAGADGERVLRITLALDDGLGREEFTLSAGQDGVRLNGGSGAALVYGAGHLLRRTRWEAGGFTPDLPVRGVREQPTGGERGVYLASHFGNVWEVGPLAQVQESLEEMALWGGNSLVVVYPLEQFAAVDSAPSLAYLARLNALGRIARGLGMRFGLITCVNVWFRSQQPAPAGTRFTPLAGCWSHGTELCPSNPAGLRLLEEAWSGLLARFEHLDLVIPWAMDEGGCGCAACAPWGGNGFLRAAQRYSAIARQRFPQCRTWLSTWWFEKQDGSYAGLFRHLAGPDGGWIDGLLSAVGQLPTALGRPHPERIPVAVFPEISMAGMTPWGGFGANPRPQAMARQMQTLAGQAVGCWPYSEGIYEDFNKMLWLGHFWTPGRPRPVAELMGDYAGYYFGSRDPRLATLLEGLEQTLERDGWMFRHPQGMAANAALAEQLDGTLPRWARSGWRWRILMLRSRIDHLASSQGLARAGREGGELQQAFAELARLYAVDPGSKWIAPLPRPKTGERAFAHAVTASSVLPGGLVTPGMVVDGLDDGRFYFSNSYWESDPRHQGGEWLCIDLGEEVAVSEVRIRFARSRSAVFAGVPHALAFSLSRDGTTFAAAGAFSEVPAEGAAGDPRFRTYPLSGHGRFLRLELGTPQRADTGLRIAKVEVY
jgi:hypothetical protein